MIKGNKIISLLLPTLLVASLGVVFCYTSDVSVDVAWHHWKNKHGKQYVDSSEEQKRRDIWQQKVDEVSHHNLRYDVGLETYKQGLNKFSDMTFEELKAKYLMSLDISQAKNSTSNQHLLGRFDVRDLPKKVDWRTKGYVTRVKNQGQCGSCWTFATAACLEGQLANKTKAKPISLSTQQIVDCDQGGSGCDGGWPPQALHYTEDNGIEPWDDYLYKGVQGDCKYDKTKVAFKNTGVLYVYQAGEDRMQQMVADYGPLAVGIQVVSSFFSYTNGVFRTNECSPGHVDHAVTVVGYGSVDCAFAGPEASVDYWIVKNSWSAEWGDKGYVNMARNLNNMCSIATYPAVALI